MSKSVKARVRRRDGRCVACGMTAGEHWSRYRQRLHVHRRKPGSAYTLSGCESRCVSCHNATHGKDSVPNARRLNFCTSPTWLDHVEQEAKRQGRSTASLIRWIVTEYMEQGSTPRAPRRPKPRDS